MTDRAAPADPREALRQVERDIRGLLLSDEFGETGRRHNIAIEQALAQFIPYADVMHPALAARQDEPNPGPDEECPNPAAIIDHPFTPLRTPVDEDDRNYRERCEWPDGRRGLICGQPRSAHEENR